MKRSPIALSLLLALLPLTSLRAADDNTVYLKERISQEKPSGIFSLNKGAKLTKISESPAGLKVRAEDGAEWTVRANQVTTSTTEGKQLADGEDAARAALDARTRAAIAAQDQAKQLAKDQTAADDRRRKELGLNTPTLVAENTEMKAAPVSQLTGSSLDGSGQRTATMKPKVRKTNNAKK